MYFTQLNKYGVSIYIIKFINLLTRMIGKILINSSSRNTSVIT